MEPGTIVVVTVPSEDVGLVVWPGWVLEADDSGVAVQTVDATGSPREVVKATIGEVRELEALARQASAEGHQFAKDETLLMRVATPSEFRGTQGYQLVGSLHDVPGGTSATLVRGYASRAGGPIVGAALTAKVDGLWSVREVVANATRARDRAG